MQNVLNGKSSHPRIKDKSLNEGAAVVMVSSSEFLEWLKPVLRRAHVTQAQLAQQLSFDATKLRKASRDGIIDVQLLDKICTHLGRPDLTHTLTEGS